MRYPLVFALALGISASAHSQSYGTSSGSPSAYNLEAYPRGTTVFGMPSPIPVNTPDSTIVFAPTLTTGSETGKITISTPAPDATDYRVIDTPVPVEAITLAFDTPTPEETPSTVATISTPEIVIDGPVLSVINGGPLVQAEGDSVNIAGLSCGIEDVVSATSAFLPGISPDESAPIDACLRVNCAQPPPKVEPMQPAPQPMPVPPPAKNFCKEIDVAKDLTLVLEPKNFPLPPKTVFDAIQENYWKVQPKCPVSNGDKCQFEMGPISTPDGTCVFNNWQNDFEPEMKNGKVVMGPDDKPKPNITRNNVTGNFELKLLKRRCQYICRDCAPAGAPAPAPVQPAPPKN